MRRRRRRNKEVELLSEDDVGSTSLLQQSVFKRLLINLKILKAFRTFNFSSQITCKNLFFLTLHSKP